MAIKRVTTLLTGPLVAGGGINQLYFADSTSAADAHSAVVDMWNLANDYMSSTVSIAIQPLVETVNEATGQLIGQASVESVNLVGAQAAEPLPPACQGLVQFRTATFINGRQLRGRLNLPGMTEGNNTDGKPTAAMVTALGAIGAVLINDAESTFVIWHRPTSMQAADGQAVAAATASGWNQWAILRSRRD